MLIRCLFSQLVLICFLIALSQTARQHFKKSILYDQLRINKRSIRLDENHGLYFDYGYSESPLSQLIPQGSFGEMQKPVSHRNAVKRNGLRTTTNRLEDDDDDDDEDDDDDHDRQRDRDNDNDRDDDNDDEFEEGRRAYLIQMRRMQMQQAMERDALDHEMLKTKLLANQNIDKLQTRNMLLQQELQQYAVAKQAIDNSDAANEPLEKGEIENKMNEADVERGAGENISEENVNVDTSSLVRNRIGAGENLSEENVDTSSLMHNRLNLASRAQEMEAASNRRDTNAEVVSELSELYQTPNPQMSQGYEQIQPNMENAQRHDFDDIPMNFNQNRQQNGIMYPSVLPNNLVASGNNFVDDQGLHVRAQVGLLENSVSKARNLYDIFYNKDRNVVALERQQLNNIAYDYPPKEPANNLLSDSVAIGNIDNTGSSRHKIHHAKKARIKKKGGNFSLGKVLNSLIPHDNKIASPERKILNSEVTGDFSLETPIMKVEKKRVASKTTLSNNTHPLTSAIKKIDDLVDTLIKFDKRTRKTGVSAHGQHESSEYKKVTENTMDLLGTLMKYEPNKRRTHNQSIPSAQSQHGDFPAVVINNSSISINAIPQSRENVVAKKIRAFGSFPGRLGGTEKTIRYNTNNIETPMYDNVSIEKSSNKNVLRSKGIASDMYNKPILKILSQVGGRKKNLEILTQVYDTDNTQNDSNQKIVRTSLNKENQPNIENSDTDIIKKHKKLREKALQAYKMREKIKQSFVHYKNLVSEVKEESHSIGTINPGPEIVPKQHDAVIGNIETFDTQQKVKPDKNIWVLNVDDEDMK